MVAQWMMRELSEDDFEPSGDGGGWRYLFPFGPMHNRYPPVRLVPAGAYLALMRIARAYSGK